MPLTARAPEDAFWLPSIAGLLQEIAASPEGLSTAEADARRLRYGPNVLVPRRRRALLVEYLSRSRNPLVLVLLAASSISALTGDLASFLIISSIVLASVTLDFVQEHRAGEAAERLRQSVAVRASVVRDGQRLEIPVEQIVPGDVVGLAAGDLVPADGRVIEARDCFVNQALLTSEPYPVEKHPGDLAEDASTGVDAATNAVFMGTSVISGSARVVIYRTGTATMLEGIAGSLEAGTPPTAFERGTREFGFLIMRLTIGLVLFVLLVTTLFHRPVLEAFLFALALAVGLTPELLPMIVSVTLSRGALRMAQKKVVVKRLPSVQDLGSMGCALHGQDRHADRGADPARSPHRRARPRQPARDRTGVSQQRLRDRVAEPAGRGDPGTRAARCGGLDADR